MRNGYKILVGNLRKTLLFKPGLRWKDRIRSKEAGCEGVDWIRLAQDKVL